MRNWLFPFSAIFFQLNFVFNTFSMTILGFIINCMHDISLIDFIGNHSSKSIYFMQFFHFAVTLSRLALVFPMYLSSENLTKFSHSCVSKRRSTNVNISLLQWFCASKTLDFNEGTREYFLMIFAIC